MSDNTDDLIISISTDQATLRRSIKRIEQDLGTLAGSVQKQFSAVGKSIDNSVSSTLQNRINGMVGIGKAASKEWTGALADQGKELDRLRAKYSPLFATINNYKTAVAEIKQAHAVGAISANEMATAISRERQAALASTAAIKGRNAALEATPAQRAAGGAGAFQTANIAAQFQDIAVQLQGGSKPLTIALQQGTQLASVFQTLGKGQSVIGALGAAFSSLISPVSLVTIGLIAAGGAAYQYFTSVSEGSDKSDEALKKEADLIQSVAQKWGDVLPELKRYADERQKLLDTKDQKDAAVAAANQQWEELRKTVGDAKANFADIVSQLQLAGAETESISALQREFNALTKGIADGTATADQARTVQKALSELAIQTGVPAIAEFAKTFDGLATSIGTVSEAAEKLKNGPLFNESLSKSRLPALGTIGPVYSDNGKLITDPNEIDRYNKQQEDNRNPTIDTGRGLPVPVPLPTAKPIQLGEEPNKKAETAATKAANAYRDLKKAADDRIGQVQQEIDLLGKYGIEADAARFSLDLFQQAEDKGRSLSATQRAEIEKKVELYKQYSETLSKAKLSQDLLNDMRYDSLSKEDQKVTTTLRQYGLPEDLNSDQAGQIRQSIKTGELRDDLHSFASDFKNALLNNGGDIGKAFGDAIQNAALNQISKIADRFIDQIINGIIGSVSGGGASAAGGSIASSIGKAIVGGVSGKAPVIPVSRSSLPDVSAYAKAIKSIESGGNYGALGPVTRSGDRAYGAYQVMGANIPSWSKEALGRSMTASEFLTDRGAQDAVFSHKFGGYADRFGASGAAQAWFGGPGSVGRGGAGRDILGTSGTEYVDKFNTSLTKASSAIELQTNRAVDAAGGLGRVAGSAGTATDGLGQLGNGLTKFGGSLSSMGGGGGWGQLSGGGGFDWASLFSPSFKPNTTFGAFLGLAAGGHVAGAGGPTDDAIPAMLSNGEYVINAAATRRHRRLLDAINSGSVARLAKGGLAGPSLAPSGRGYGNDNVEIKIINNNGSKVSQTKRKTSSGQTIEMVIDDMVADKMSTPGSRSRSAVQSQFGLQGGLARR
ncbi:phage tail length tape measure family protein [Rhizobium ruizarguesonis]|uniref:phage tail length tape measure family protein n=1 Tax=Rhizobium ruizarguesonis TaxID=2081791 RepID=UPI00102FAEB5|nr:phage tail length tape measure family protein [Rhizobium ruizarguesonis]TBA38427.1 tail length tape measure protein [Rhizobium ruizarguesonis]